MDPEVQSYMDTAERLGLIPSSEYLDAFAEHVVVRQTGRADDQLAPIWREKLRHTYTRVLEHKYPELQAANGEVLQIDTAVDPAALEWEYFMLDGNGYADWIDDDGHVMPGSSFTMTRHTGRMAEMGHTWEANVFDLERAVKAGVPFLPIKQKLAKKAHDRTTNWVWLFGDSGKNLPGLCNHPNIRVTRAPLNGGATSRHFRDKSADEIADDFATLIDTIATGTLRAYHAATVFIPLELAQIMRRARLGSGDGLLTLWDWVQDTYKGDDTGQGKITFKVLNECTASWRADPRSGDAATDNSGIGGDFMLAIPGVDKEELCFIRARPYTQRPPQERDFNMYHPTHSKIGGCKVTCPTAVHRVDFF